MKFQKFLILKTKKWKILYLIFKSKKIKKLSTMGLIKTKSKVIKVLIYRVGLISILLLENFTNLIDYLGP